MKLLKIMPFVLILFITISCKKDPTGQPVVKPVEESAKQEVEVTMNTMLQLKGFEFKTDVKLSTDTAGSVLEVDYQMNSKVDEFFNTSNELKVTSLGIDSTVHHYTMKSETGIDYFVEHSLTNKWYKIAMDSTNGIDHLFNKDYGLQSIKKGQEQIDGVSLNKYEIIIPKDQVENVLKTLGEAANRIIENTPTYEDASMILYVDPKSNYIHQLDLNVIAIANGYKDREIKVTFEATLTFTHFNQVNEVIIPKEILDAAVVVDNSVLE